MKSLFSADATRVIWKAFNLSEAFNVLTHHPAEGRRRVSERTQVSDLDQSSHSRSFTLSLRERAGARGKKMFENLSDSIPDKPPRSVLLGSVTRSPSPLGRG